MGLPEPFSYPTTEIHTCEDKHWELGLESTEKTLVRFCITEERAFNDFVYLGAGVWARTNQEGDRLLGGPEMTDNLLVNEKRWAAKLLKTKE